MGCCSDINNKVKSHHKMTQEYVSHLGQGPGQYASSGKCRRNLVASVRTGEGKRGGWSDPSVPLLSGGGSTAPLPGHGHTHPEQPAGMQRWTPAPAWRSAFPSRFAPFTQITSMENYHWGKQNLSTHLLVLNYCVTYIPNMLHKYHLI